MFDFLAMTDYLVIGGIAFVAIIVISLFVDGGPKKVFAILGVLATAGIAAFFLNKRNKYTAAGLKKHNEKIKKLIDLVDERDKVIEKNNGAIEKLSNERAEIEKSANVDKEKIAEINERIDKRLEVAETINTQIEAQEEVLKKHAENRAAEKPLESSADILAKFGLGGKRATAKPVVADPQNVESKSKITIRGFTMKGDV